MSVAARKKMASAAGGGRKAAGSKAKIPPEIDTLDGQLLRHFQEQIRVDPMLTRKLVSFQANRTRAAYRWFKFKEAFSAELVEYFFRQCGVAGGKVLDPFAGIGTALFTANRGGLEAEGIELLPVGQEIIAARLLRDAFTQDDFSELDRWARTRPWRKEGGREPLPRLRITEGAYPSGTVDGIERYLGAMLGVNGRLRAVLRLALLCVLETVSYTFKDGQYLRWDDRSGRRHGRKKTYHKGLLPEFDAVVSAKIAEISGDLRAEGEAQASPLPGSILLHPGSCLDILPQLPSNEYDGIITSPPYCNRYDYTRTYALELALLGVGDQELWALRQKMLSCTVESRTKDLLHANPAWFGAVLAADREELLQAILGYLEQEKAAGRLNNTGIPRMVRGYFYEMACVIAECCRVLKPGAPCIIVNDNVRYAGVGVSVDLILSHLAECLGYRVEAICSLPEGKGNSSQQMAVLGRQALRKGVYIWRKL